MSIHMLPEELVAQQEQALEYMHHAYLLALKKYGPIQAIGLGGLCSVVASRGAALQQKVSVPVTTGNAATAWCIYQHVLKKYSDGRIAILGTAAPVGKGLAQLLAQEEYNISIDSKRLAKKLKVPFGKPQEILSGASFVLACAPTGPSLSAEYLDDHAQVIDVALPYTFEHVQKHTIFQGEAMSMPNNWKRGFWGPLYHLVSGYGWNTVLACLVEALPLVSQERSESFAQGKQLTAQNIRDFGKEIEQLGFYPRLIQHR